MFFGGESKSKFRNSSYFTFLNASILLLWFKWSRYLFVGNDFEFFDIILFTPRGLHPYLVWRHLLLVFSVTPFKIDQNQNQNRSIDKAQNLGSERRYICNDPRQILGQRNISYARYSKKPFTQIYRDLYGDAMLVPIRINTNMADGNQQKHLLPSFATKAWIYASKNS